MINIALASDMNFFDPAKVLLKSIADNCTQQINVYYLHADITQEDQERFIKDCAPVSDHLEITFVEVDAEALEREYGTSEYSRPTYFRLCIPDLLPAALDRVLYLDCDIIVNRPLDELYNTDFERNLFIACEDYGVSVTKWYAGMAMPARIGREMPQDKYFNAGVLLINLDKARKIFSSNVVFNTLEQYRSKIEFADQDILNHLYGDQVKYADHRIYNASSWYVSPGDEDWVMDNTVIIHYYGPTDVKPWRNTEKNKSVSALTRLWWKYAEYFEHYRN